MHKVTELTVYTNGPAGELTTWSNVPYYFTRALLERGLRVNLVNLDPPPVWEILFNLSFRQAWKLAHPDTTFTYFRSARHARWVEARIRRALLAHPRSQADILLTFSFAPPRPHRRPVVLVCDWPYRHSLERFPGRPADRLEAASIDREERQIGSADLVVSLFPGVAEAMRARFPAVRVRYLGQAVNLPEAPDSTRLLARKAASRALLFIGDAKYLEGARVLLEAYTRLRASDPGLSLDFIGLEAGQLGPLPPGVTCHGYLDKGRPVELARYRALLESARILVNTTPHWGAFSSLLEALYCSTPLVVAPYEEFVRIFGRELPFGLYCEPNRPDLLAERLSRLLAHGDYPALARAAHAAVADFTWANFTGHLLTEIEALR